MKELIENNKNILKIFNLKDDSIIKFGDKMLNEEVISTGSLQLDKALGVNGLPKGKIIEIFGNESCGKTTISLQILKMAQKNNMNCLFLDLENTLNIKFLEKMDINLSKLLVANPVSGEQSFEIIEKFLNNQENSFIVVDSVAAMLPECERDADFDSLQVGAHARLMSKGLRKIAPLIAKTNSIVIFINQTREKIGVLFGNPETTTGGKALKFFSTIRLEVKKAELIKTGLDKVGIKSKITVIKNKVAAPLKSAYFDIYFDSGYNEMFEIIGFAIEYNILSKNGSWYSYNDKKIAQGIDQLKKFFENNIDIYEEVKNLTLNHIKS